VAESVKGPFLWRLCDRKHVISVQLQPSSDMLCF